MQNILELSNQMSINKLLDDLVCCCFKYLYFKDHINTSLVSKKWNQYAHNKNSWCDALNCGVHLDKLVPWYPSFALCKKLVIGGDASIDSLKTIRTMKRL